MMRQSLFAAGAAATLALGGILAMTGQASASYTVQVGYADDLRPSPLFPTPFCAGEGNVQSFVGDSSHCGTGPTQLDSGAIRIINTGASSISIDGLHVNVPTWFGNGVGGVDLWTGALPIVLAAGNSAVFVQTAGENFDTSDFGIPGLPPDPFNNCSQGVIPAACAGMQPIVTPTVDGVSTAFTDTAFILNTGGFDSVNSNPCIGGNNGTGNSPGNCNESLPWRDIGGSGLLPTPEPASLAILGSALAGLSLIRRRKRNRA